MKIICWLIFISFNSLIMFVLIKKFERAFLMKFFPACVPVILIVSILPMVIRWLLHISSGQVFRFYFLSIVFSLIIICLTNFANQVFFYMLDEVLSFHRQNNTANLNRQPIKFFIEHQSGLRLTSTIVWFLGSSLMLYGIWLGK
jgi:hypothetical protein